ncbi:methyl farnesoate epoxidase-like isoform X2 [Hylaeus volcanicus]|uniref:methyl farnesoate epoxidase-like isoform X2 n=1 Tax=Hylaeus volcanicus TaxID=313075 RepID=UPI0023B81EDD|nr:methyl farnesoate epoxidase-like isoform X2 [Hylaeus volcanicus]
MWLGILCLVVALIFVLSYDYYRRPHKFPPAEKYGPIVGLRLGFDQPVVVVSGKAAITEMLNRPEFDGRPQGFIFRFRCGGFMRGLLLTDTDVWHSQRRFALRTLRQFGFGKLTMDDILQRDAIALTNIIIESTKNEPLTNMYSVISAAVFSNLWFILDGTKFDVGTETAEFKEAIHVFKNVLKSVNVSGGVLNPFPFLRFLFPGLTGFSAMKERHKHLDDFFMDVISKHKSNNVGGESTNFIDSYLEEVEAQKAKSSSSSFSEQQLVYVLKDLFVAGVDTTDNSLGFVIAFLVVHQDVQNKVHNEIDEVIGKDICPSLNDRNRLPYLNAVLTEVLRLANITGTTLPHRALADTNLLGYGIKKNYSLLANLKSVHMDKEHWGDPEVFRPERFIDDNGQFVDDSWVIPFGLGRRKCLGETVAKNTMFLFAACLFQKLHFMLPEKDPEPSLLGVDGFITSPPAMNIIVVQRH